MEALNDIVRVNYDYIFDYLIPIGELTLQVINTDMEKVAQLAIEVWSTIAEVEITRAQKGLGHQNIIKNCSESVIQIILTVFSKYDSSIQDQDLEEMPESNCSMSAGAALENVARTIGNDVLEPIFNFI
jgi:hypothetical protein